MARKTNLRSVISAEKIDGFKKIIQAEYNSDDAKTDMRLCVDFVHTAAKAIAGQDVNRFRGALLNAADMYNRATILNLGVSEEEANRRMTAARNMLFHGNVEGSISEE